MTAWLPTAANVPLQPSPLAPPEGVQTALSALDHVNVTGAPAVALAALAASTTWKLPLPDKFTVEGPAPVLMLSVAAAGPADTGSNTTLILQLPPTATDVPQVLVCENG